MTLYTVQCGYVTYYDNTVHVEADSLDAALEKAIERANDDPHWKALDHCGPTFVDAVAEGERLVLINHYPLRADLVRLFRIPRLTPWCGTRATEEWHRRYPVDVVVTGHLHMRATDWRDGVRFEEVALGYPRHWRADNGIGHYIRQILPRVPAPPGGRGGPIWHR